MAERPSLVHSAKRDLADEPGSTQACPGPFGFGVERTRARASGASTRLSSTSVFCVKPVPTLPA